ncbi:hypothetical protein B0A54_17919 [Friedmanniomyces endolithicus]|uniref:Uncharacterized protein n=1 Tax=Friedmanniomyces endolithicus TaxID=329885 RepID=A0A4U0TR82_9PEZI|nr:hypothetical protein B0A54_17919 [Friedmanniomyces endolithicus]
MSRFRVLEMDTLMERNESGAGRNVSTILDEIESLFFRLRKLTAHLYAIQGKSAVEDGNTEQNFDPILQRIEHFAQQRAETQESWPKPVNQELVMRRRLVTMKRHPEQIDHRVGHSPDDQEWIDNKFSI